MSATRTANVDRKLRNAITVADLISTLEGMDPETVVLFACDYGDHCHTQQALPVTNVEGMRVADITESAYSQSGLQLVESDDEDEIDPAELAELSAEERAAYDAEIERGEAPIVVLQS